MAPKTIQIPVITTAERDALASPPAGSMIAHQETMTNQFTWDGGSTWAKISDSINSSPRNMIYVDTINGNDTIGTGTISAPFATWPPAAAIALIDGSPSNFYIITIIGNLIITGNMLLPPFVTLTTNLDGIITVTGQLLLDPKWLTQNNQTSILDEGNIVAQGGYYFDFQNSENNYIRFSNMSNLYTPSMAVLCSDTVNSSYVAMSLNDAGFFNGGFTSGITISNCGVILIDGTVFGPINVTNTSSTGNYSFLYLHSSVVTGPISISSSNTYGVNMQVRDTSINNLTIDGTGAFVNIDANSYNFTPVLTGGALISQITAAGITVNSIKTPVLTSSTDLDISATNITLDSDGGLLQMTQSLTGTFEEGVTINNQNNGIEIKTANGDFKAEATSGTLLLTGSSGMYMKIDNGQWNMDMTVSGNPSTWLMSSDFNMNFPYGGGTFNVTTPDDINLTSSAGSVNVLANSGTITLGSSATALVTMPAQNVQVGDYGGAGTTSVTLSGGVVSMNTAGAPVLTLDGGSEETTLGGVNTTIVGNSIVTLIEANSSTSLTIQNAIVSINTVGQPTLSLDGGSENTILGGATTTVFGNNALVLESASGDILINPTNKLGFWGAATGQSPPIADAAILLTDVVAQFNTLLQYLRDRGDIAT